MEKYKQRAFANGKVYALKTKDNYLIEVTDTFLPYYTKNVITNNHNKLSSYDLGNRTERWMIGVSTMSGCPCKCKFCATGKLQKFRNLTADEIVNQVEFIISNNKDYDFCNAKEHKINYTRMGEPFLNIKEVKKAIYIINKKYPNTHHYVSTIGIKNSDFSWIKDNISLQLSVHSLDNDRRNNLLPYKNKLSLEELGKIRIKSDRKITLNLSLVDEQDFDIDILKKYFDKEYFFIKLSPINMNDVCIKNNINKGVFKYEKNII